MEWSTVTQMVNNVMTQPETVTLETTPLMPRIYINAFPKSGTHLAYLAIAHLAQPQKPTHHLGSFQDNCWTNRWANVPRIVDILEWQPAGTWVIGHMGYRDEFAEIMQKVGTCMVFVYRDLRDVAVSQTYHIESDDDTFRHPDKKLFMELGSHEARLKAVIEGHGRFPGIVERWEMFAPWLDCEWVLPVKFEDLRTDQRGCAEKILAYVIKRTAQYADFTPIVYGENYENMVQWAADKLQTTTHSSTFRKGQIGNWRDEFTPEIRKLFNERNNGWLERLGYRADPVEITCNPGSLGAQDK